MTRTCCQFSWTGWRLLSTPSISRFPDFGFYNLPEWVTKEIAQSKCVVADAIDDILDIGNDLLDVEWRWANTSEADALWHFQTSYSSHWQAHLRGLQLYILSRSWEADTA
jgi:hypothetical protein